MKADYDLVDSRAAFVDYLHAMRADLEAGEHYWQNGSMESFLDALAYWVKERMPDYYGRDGVPLPPEDSWKTVADVLLAAACSLGKAA